MEELEEKWKNFTLTKEEFGFLHINPEDVAETSDDEDYFRLLGSIWKGKRTNLESMVKALGAIWKPKGTFSVKEIQENRFLFNFEEEEDFERIKDGRPWHFNGNVIVLKDLDGEDTDPDDMDFGHEEFWLHVIGLPTKLMVKGTAVAIGNQVGKFVEVDGDGGDLRDKFLRVKVLIDLAKPLPRGVMISTGTGKVKWVSFQYEKLPRFCYKCGIIGHYENECRRRCFDENGVEVKDQYGDFLLAPYRRRATEYVFEGGSRQQH